MIDAAGALAEIRRSNWEAVRGAFHNYAWSFSGSTVAWPETPAMPGDWQLLVRVEGVATLLEALKRPDVTREEAQAVACLPAFTEMMTHRRDLGYVPEPLITADGLAWCIQHAASDDPLDALWRWLHPHNFFDLSDLRAHLSGYEQLVKDVDAHKSELASAVLGRIAAFVAPDFSFHDELTFAVGWGIRGWATRKTGGINLEHFKDDTESLLKTLTHETFHRLQVHLCPADASSTADGFERIIRRSLGDARDEALFRALAYLMLEGSATYVAAQRLDASWRASADSALDLLVRIRNLSAEDVEQQLDALLNEGLKSNGPFYGFGALLSDAIVRSDGNLGLGHALRQGAPAFAYRGLTILAEKGLTVPAGLLESVADLAKRVA